MCVGGDLEVLTKLQKKKKRKKIHKKQKKESIRKEGKNLIELNATTFLFG